jgi:predicted nucleic acid-binding protein
MKKILIDTDVILDFFFDRSPYSDDAARILSLSERKKIKGFVTPVMISNVYYLLRKSAPHDKVIEYLKRLLTIVDVLSVNKNSVLQALNSNFKDFEDALQNFSTFNERNIHTIITRNTKDYKTSELSIMTPEMFLRSLT